MDAEHANFLCRKNISKEKDPTYTPAEVIYATFTATRLSGDDPLTLKEARESPKWPNWEKAIQAELKQWGEIQTWELVDKPPDTKSIQNKWVFLRKYNNQGELIKYKAPLVAKGFIQRPGQDYNETYSPVVRFETICAIMALVSKNGPVVQWMQSVPI